MPLQANDVILLTFQSTWQNQVIMMTHNYRVFSPPTGTVSTEEALQALITYVDPAGGSSLGDSYLKCLPPNVTLRAIWAQKIYPVREVRQEQAMADVGRWEGEDATTGNVAAVLTIRTQKAGRNQVSNKHIGPLPSDGYDIGRVSPTLLTPLEILADNLRTALGTPDGGIYQPVIYHKSGGGPGDNVDVLHSAVVQQQIRTMSRRTVGRGI